MKNFIYLMFGIILFSACEDMSKNIDIEIPDLGRKVVVNSLFANDSLIVINLTKSRQILDNSSTYEQIDNATVTLYENNLLKEDLQFISNGNYKSTTKPKPGNTYKIKVIAPGLPEAGSSSLIPVQVPIIAVDTVYLDIKPQQFLFSQTMYGSIRGTKERALRCRIKIMDPKGLNYYSLSVKQSYSNIGGYNLTFCFDDPGYNNSNYLKAITGNLGHGSEEYSLVFSDNLFEGNEYYLVIYIYVDEFQFNKNPIIFNLKSITADYYTYCLGFIATYSDEQILRTLFAEKIPIYNNVKNGYGMFSGYCNSTYSLIV